MKRSDDGSPSLSKKSNEECMEWLAQDGTADSSWMTVMTPPMLNPIIDQNWNNEVAIRKAVLLRSFVMKRPAITWRDVRILNHQSTSSSHNYGEHRDSSHSTFFRLDSLQISAFKSAIWNRIISNGFNKRDGLAISENG